MVPKLPPPSWRHRVGAVSAVFLALLVFPLLAWVTLLLIVGAVGNLGAGSLRLGFGGLVLAAAGPVLAVLMWRRWSRRGLRWDQLVRRLAAVSFAAVYVTLFVAYAAAA
jgi:hypothetical protein